MRAETKQNRREENFNAKALAALLPDHVIWFRARRRPTARWKRAPSPNWAMQYEFQILPKGSDPNARIHIPTVQPNSSR